jgi:hypothetical protein
LGNIWNQWIIRVRVSEKGADRKQDLANSQSRTPLVLQDVQANTSVGVDVTVIDTSGKVNLGWLERIVSGEMNIQKENTSCIWGLIWSHNSCLPVEHIIAYWSCRTVGRGVFSQVDKF